MLLTGQRNLLAIIQEWDGMVQDFIKKMIDSMPKKLPSTRYNNVICLKLPSNLIN